ncbi:RUS1 family protein-like protein [Colletotrichum orbiculare MAFF 240422]|uniref:RUS1 family protein-like protein n=1 Tax=Colletotrichum orbiculare (strain 104-T / ATCC 96160 / CBS 514.97 / LARS 414 / MAFF 240422) TaxID=1213857 RepID=N4VV13_COLOR|nr:RUS1 family protein-like protein [Colletotrichum orbiculare MAFF 240422]
MSAITAQVLVKSPKRVRKSADLAVAEYDRAGNLKAKYVQSAPMAGSSRVDILLPTKRKQQWRKLLDVFLSDGYPHSVTDDYTEYQIYASPSSRVLSSRGLTIVQDSFQAFAGTIAGMISSRAVWEGMGVGDSMASPTGAMMVQVIRESMGRFGTIAFAHLMGTSIEAECKSYRLAADVLQDVAHVIDCLSPIFPTSVRFVVLCFSSVLFSASGVAGNASKSSLSGHFAKWNNLGELNAKDGSQETAISLMGMIVGTVVVSFLTTTTATWSALIFLLGIHLFLNWKGVRAVKARSLNRQRANIAFSSLLSTDKVLTPTEVSQREAIFESRGGEVLRWNSHAVLGHCKFGMPLESLLSSLAGGRHAMRSFELPAVTLAALMDVFEQQEYILWCEVRGAPGSRNRASDVRVVVVLKNGVSGLSQLRAWFHGLLLASRLGQLDGADLLRARLDQRTMLCHVEAALRQTRERYEGYARRLSAVGWNLEVAVLETRSGSRIARESSDETCH